MLAIYFASFAALSLCLGCVQAADGDFMPSQDGNDAAIDFFMTYGCKSSATDAQIAAAEKCFQVANMEFYDKVVESTNGGTCPTSSPPSMGLTAFCKSLTGKDDASRKLVECASKAYGRYPDSANIPMTAKPVCDAAKTA